jgi:hypothetical protein
VREGSLLHLRLSKLNYRAGFGEVGAAGIGGRFVGAIWENADLNIAILKEA